MKSFKQFLLTETNQWALPDYPEQVMGKDDPEGNWVTGDSPKPIETFPDVDGTTPRDIESTTAAISKANAIVRKEREAQKPK